MRFKQWLLKEESEVHLREPFDETGELSKMVDEINSALGEELKDLDFKAELYIDQYNTEIRVGMFENNGLNFNIYVRYDSIKNGHSKRTIYYKTPDSRQAAYDFHVKHVLYRLRGGYTYMEQHAYERGGAIRYPDDKNLKRWSARSLNAEDMVKYIIRNIKKIADRTYVISKKDIQDFQNFKDEVEDIGVTVVNSSLRARASWEYASQTIFQGGTSIRIDSSMTQHKFANLKKIMHHYHYMFDNQAAMHINFNDDGSLINSNLRYNILQYTIPKNKDFLYIPPEFRNEVSSNAI